MQKSSRDGTRLGLGFPFIQKIQIDIHKFLIYIDLHLPLAFRLFSISKSSNFKISFH